MGASLSFGDFPILAQGAQGPPALKALTLLHASHKRKEQTSVICTCHLVTLTKMGIG